MSSGSVQPNLPLASPMAGKPSQVPLSGEANLGKLVPAKSPPAPEKKVREKGGGLPWIPMEEDHPFWRKVMTCTIVQGWLMLVSSLLVILFVVADLGGHCTSGSRESHVTSPYSPKYPQNLSSSRRYYFERNISSRTPIAHEEPTSSHSYEYPNCGGLVLAILGLVLSHIAVVHTVLGLIFFTIYKVVVKEVIYQRQILSYIFPNLWESLGCKMSLYRLSVSVLTFCREFLMSSYRLLCCPLLLALWNHTAFAVMKSTSFFPHRQNSPAVLTAFNCLFLLFIDIFILSSAYLMRMQLKNHQEAIRAQAGASRVVQVVGFGKVQPKSQGLNVGNRAPSKSPTATEMKIKEKTGGLSWIRMEDRSFWRKVMTCITVQGWLMLVSSLLLIFLVGADLGGHCTNELRESHVISPYLPRYPESLNSSRRFDFERNNSSRTPIAHEKPTSTHSYEYPNCGDVVLALLALVLSFITVVFNIFGLILYIIKKMSLYSSVYGFLLFVLWTNTTYDVMKSTSFFPDRQNSPDYVLTALNCLSLLCFDISILSSAYLIRMQLKNLDEGMRAQADATKVAQA